MSYYTQFGENPAENYERFFVPSIGRPAGAQLVELANLQRGERVLDAGCGTGIIARLAAERVGPGCVTALDVTAPMLAVARTVTPPEAVASWHEASIEAMPLGDQSFDVVLCQLVLQFVGDKQAALCEMRRVLAPGGRLLLSTIGPTPPLFAVMRDALARHLGPQVAGFVNAVFSMHEPAALRALAEGAGLADISVATRATTFRLPPPRDFLWQYINSTPLAMMLAQAGDKTRDAIERDIVPAWLELVTDGQLVGPVPVHVLTARRS